MWAFQIDHNTSKLCISSGLRFVTFIIQCVYPSTVEDQNHGLSPRNYADDTQLFVRIDGQDDMATKYNSCMTEIQQWMAMNLFKLNTSKTEVTVFGNPRLTFPLDTGPQADRPCPEPVRTVRNLGVELDQNLNMKAQISKVVQNCSYQPSLILRLAHYLPLTTYKTVVNALVISRLDYCYAVYANMSGAALSKLQKIQNAAARLGIGLPRRRHDTLLQH